MIFSGIKGLPTINDPDIKFKLNRNNNLDEL
ncbi:hypothetical protein SAMN05444380_11239 [Thermophagus xiamenensis]|uniref:Uncharacterized protein n=1 Tax=Thermophagus xiamenensis TaxID=385682 RepID=A0A1I2AY55_9BACT|nr:hypothetical protein SAMN05444380_11239 [Thermophagus xiamenensis]